VQSKLLLAATCATGVLGVASPAMAATLTVDDNKVQCPSAGYTSIKSAVAAAADGDTINVCVGSYAGPITLDKSVNLNSVSRRSAEIDAPATQADPRDDAVVTVVGSGVAAKVQRFVINAKSATAQGGCAGQLYGVHVVEGASATINDNEIADARDSDNSLLGCQHGLAIAFGGKYATDGAGTVARTNGSGIAIRNDITGYQKGGVLVDTAPSTATVRANNITGAGCVGYIASNGVQVSRGARGTVYANTIKDNCYTGADQAAGILMFQAADHNVIGRKSASSSWSGNVLDNNDLGIGVLATRRSVFGANTITGSPSLLGVGIGNYKKDPAQGTTLSSLGNRYFDNHASGNAVDCLDDTDGLLTADTGDIWTGNHGTVSNIVGICAP
jgi:hypothetical protein